MLLKHEMRVRSKWSEGAWYLAVVLGLTAFLGYPNSMSASPAQAQEQAGASCEDSRFTEVRDELRRIRQEMVAVREALREIHLAAVNPPSLPALALSTTELNLDRDDPVLGNTDAVVAIVEFSDYECPFCSRFQQQTFNRIKESYVDTGKAVYISRDFPLEFHSNARSASIAVNCAADQNKYWVFKDSLFANQRRLGSELYLELADTHGLDSKRFSGCMKNRKNEKEIDHDISYGKELGVTGTPTFFIGRLEGGKLVNVQRIVGAQPFLAFKRAIESRLTQ
jgi:protein-disulfide isomerase